MNTDYASMQTEHTRLSQTMSELREEAAGDRAKLQELIKASHDECDSVGKRFAALQGETEQLVCALEESKQQLEVEHKAYLAELDLNASYVKEICRSQVEYDRNLKALKTQVSHLEGEKLNSWLDEYSGTYELGQVSLTECLKMFNEIKEEINTRVVDAGTIKDILGQVKSIPEGVTEVLAQMQTAHTGEQTALHEGLGNLSLASQEVKTLARDVSGLRQAIDNFRATMEGHASALYDRTSESRIVVEIVQELLDSHETDGTLTTRIEPPGAKSIISMLEELRVVHTNLSSERKTYNERCEQLTRELVDLRDKSNASQDELGRVIQAAASSPEPFLVLLDHLRPLAPSASHPFLNRLSQQQKDVCKEADESRTALKELTVQYQIIPQEIQTLKHEEVQAKDRAHDLRYRLEEKHREFDAADQKVHELEDRITKLRAELAENVKVENEAERHEMMVTELQAKSSECYTLQEKLAHAKDQIRNLEHSLEAASVARKGMDAETDQLRKTVADQRNDISRLSSLQRELDHSVQTTETLKSEVASLQVKVKERNILQRRNDELEKVLKSQQLEVIQGRHQAEITKLQTVLQEEESSLSTLRNEIQSLKAGQKDSVDLEQSSKSGVEELSRMQHTVRKLERRLEQSEAADEVLTEEELRSFDQDVALSLPSQSPQSQDTAKRIAHEGDHTQIPAGDESDENSEDEPRPIRRAAQRPRITEEDSVSLTGDARVAPSWHETGIVEETQYDTPVHTLDISSDLSPPASEDQLERMIEHMYEDRPVQKTSSQRPRRMLNAYNCGLRPGTSSHDMLLHSEPEHSTPSTPTQRCFQRHFVPPAGQPITQVPASSDDKSSQYRREKKALAHADTANGQGSTTISENDSVSDSPREMHPPNSSAKRQRFAEQDEEPSKRAKTLSKNLEVRRSTNHLKFLRHPQPASNESGSGYNTPTGARPGGSVADAAITASTKGGKKLKTVRKGSRGDKYGKRFGSAV